MKEIVLCDDSKLETVAPLCKRYKVGIEIQSFAHPTCPNKNPEELDIHKKELIDIQTRALHGPFADLCPGSFDEMIREVTRNRYEFAYDKAIKLSATHIVLHHGYVPKTSKPGNWLKRIIAFWNDFLMNKSADIQFHIENLLELDPYLLSEVISGIDRGNVDVCLDIGHAHCNSRKSVIEWIKILNKQIGYIHMHDNHGENDEHLGFGEGKIPFVDVCDVLEEYCPMATWAIETKTNSIEKSLLWIRENGYKII